MKYLSICSLLMLLAFSTAAVAATGMVSIKSKHSVKASLDKLEQILDTKGLTVFTRIKHSENAEKAGQSLRPTELLIFGNPNMGSPLMRCQQSIALDLPQKTLAWEDDNGQVWLSYNSPSYLVDRHGVRGCEEILKKMENALSKLVSAASQ